MVDQAILDHGMLVCSHQALHEHYPCVCKSYSFVSHLHVQLLLQPAHCSDVTPISKPDERFACPEDTEYNPVQDLMLEPNAKKCCKVGSKTRLIDSQKQRFNLGHAHVLKRASPTRGAIQSIQSFSRWGCSLLLVSSPHAALNVRQRVARHQGRCEVRVSRRHRVQPYHERYLPSQGKELLQGT